MMAVLYHVIGLMSGTSLDGVDAAWLETDGERVIKAGPAITLPYPDSFRDELRAVLGAHAPQDDIARVERLLTGHHAQAVASLRAGHDLPVPDLIGFHGHTILHVPDERRTWQIGDAGLLAALTGTEVAFDFRTADVASGGQGAPLVPVYHRAIAGTADRPLAVLNLGGVANVTWIGAEDGDLLAFDTGPGNALIDDWALRHTGRPVDQDGRLAAAGQADQALIDRFLAQPFFAASPPKSLDRDSFAHLLPHHLSAEDGAATLTALTAEAVARAERLLPGKPMRWLVTGGGRRNPTLMAALAGRLSAPVLPVEHVGWDGDALEAQAFAYLAVRTKRGLPLSFPGTTGVPMPMPGGRLVQPLMAAAIAPDRPAVQN